MEILNDFDKIAVPYLYNEHRVQYIMPCTKASTGIDVTLINVSYGEFLGSARILKI